MFWILSPEQFFAVSYWLIGYSERPLVAMLVWTRIPRVVDPNTGELLVSQEELSRATNIGARDVPRVLNELVRIGAMTRRLVKVRGVRGSGVARYYLNPSCPEFIPPPKDPKPGRANRSHRAAAAPPTLVLEDTGEQRFMWGDLLALADQVVRESQGKVTARTVQRFAKVSRPLAMLVLEGAKQRVRAAELQSEMVEAPAEAAASAG